MGLNFLMVFAPSNQEKETEQVWYCEKDPFFLVVLRCGGWFFDRINVSTQFNVMVPPPTPTYSDLRGRQ